MARRAGEDWARHWDDLFTIESMAGSRPAADWRVALVGEVAHAHLELFTCAAMTMARETKSPIEERMLYGLLHAALAAGHAVPPLTHHEYPDNYVKIEPQHQFGTYCLDFLVEMLWYGHSVKVAVECDGRDFHERTKEQARHDKRRDRSMVAKGLIVLRFTGSEIHANALACGKEVIDQLMGMAEAMRG